MSTLYAFPPIIGEDPHILILGTMPGVRSLYEGQYYAHPQNQFWRFMGELYGAGPHLPYEKRIDIVTKQGLAIWDVLQSCNREGSLDSAIYNPKANDFSKFFKDYPTIKHVIFDSRTAEKIFYKQKFELPSYLTFHQVPSPSPAYASLRYEAKLQIWKQVLEPLDKVTQ